jgi:secreted trypsin-like serine protease
MKKVNLPVFRSAAIVCALVFACPPASQAIKQRTSREVSRHPEAVLVSGRNSKTGAVTVCSGALISSRAVLTAAHCAVGFDSWKVLAPYARGGPAAAASSDARVHPQHEVGQYENDLAVLILDKDIAIEGSFPGLNGGNLLPIETRLLVIGRVGKSSRPGPRLFAEEVTRVAFPGNIHVYGAHPQVTEKGDSGGPVYTSGKEQEIVAVVSGFAEFERGQAPLDLYVPITSRNRDWILRQLPGPAVSP